MSHFRIARPVSSLEPSARMYQDGLGWCELSRFTDHEGFDGIMLGSPGASFHFEFTFCRTHPVQPRPTEEDLLVLYLPEAAEWLDRGQRMLAAGFIEVPSYNPYWSRKGRTFQDFDGYRTVVWQGSFAI